MSKKTAKKPAAAAKEVFLKSGARVFRIGTSWKWNGFDVIEVERCSDGKRLVVPVTSLVPDHEQEEA